MRLEQGVLASVGAAPQATEDDVRSLDWLPGDAISAFRLVARGTGDILFEAGGGATYTWLATAPGSAAASGSCFAFVGLLLALGVRPL